MKKFKRVLYLDDEENNLKSFYSLFNDDFEVYTAETAAEALKILSNKEVQVILSDHRMPNVTGVDFLSSIIELYPEPIRILTTGYSDIEAVIQSVNKAKVYYYLTKPWDLFLARLTLENAIRIYYENKSTNQAPPPTKNKIFISHSSKDIKLVSSFVDNILKLCIGLNDSDIFCTSIEEMGIRSGQNFREAIKTELINSKVIIQIITANYKESEVCMNEMGAAWVLNKNVVPFILSPINFTNVGFIQSSNQLLALDQKDKLLKFIEDSRGSLYDLNLNVISVNRYIDIFINSIIKV